MMDVLIARFNSLSPLVRKAFPVAAGAVVVIVVAGAARWWLSRDSSSLVAPSLAPIFAPSIVGTRRVTPADAEAAGETLGAAFSDDPLICAMTELQQPQRKAAAVRVYKALIRAASPASRGLVVIGSQAMDAVALWMPPSESS